MIPELRVTLQGAATGRIQRHVTQSHVSHYRVLPLGEFTVTIPKTHATLQGAVIFRNQCHDRATLQGVRVPSAISKIIFAIFNFFWFLCSLGYDEWQLSYCLRYTFYSIENLYIFRCHVYKPSISVHLWLIVVLTAELCRSTPAACRPSSSSSYTCFVKKATTLR